MSSRQRNLEQRHRSFILKVNSSHRTNDGDGTTDFKIQLGKEVSNFKVSRIVLRSLNFLNSMYNINQYNNVLELITGADGLISRTIPPGQYNLSALITELQNQFNAVLTNNLTIVQNTIQNTLTFSIDGGDIINFSNQATSTLNSYLGIINQVAGASSITAQQTPRLNGLTSVIVESQALAPANYHSNTRNRNFLTSIQVSSDYGTYVNWESFTAELASHNYSRPRKLDSTIDLRFLDQDENLIDIQSQNIELEIICYHE